MKTDILITDADALTSFRAYLASRGYLHAPFTHI
jgi:hypothetical protein